MLSLFYTVVGKLVCVHTCFFLNKAKEECGVGRKVKGNITERSPQSPLFRIVSSLVGRGEREEQKKALPRDIFLPLHHNRAMSKWSCLFHIDICTLGPRFKPRPQRKERCHRQRTIQDEATLIQVNATEH